MLIRWSGTGAGLRKSSASVFGRAYGTLLIGLPANLPGFLANFSSHLVRWPVSRITFCGAVIKRGKAASPVCRKMG